jgi:diguanylate cyclase (GGDEF)-like protein
MDNNVQKEVGWLLPLKKKILVGIFGILAVSMSVTVFFIVTMLRDGLLTDSAVQTRELGNAIKNSVNKMMVMRSPVLIQDAIEDTVTGDSSIVKAFVLDRTGRIAYSSDKKEIGQVLDRHRNPSCVGCHQRADRSPPQNTIVMEREDRKIHRNVMVIYNEKACYGCHPPSARINGKLIIDKSLESTNSLICRLELIIFGSGLLCLVILFPFLSKLLNKYVREIIRQNNERSLLYGMIERLSKSIEIEELKPIVIDILSDALDADEVSIVIPKDTEHYSVSFWSRTDGAVTRKKVEEGDPLRTVLDRWLKDGFADYELSEDGRLIYMPVEKSGTRLALVALRKHGAAFSPERLNLIGIINGHIAISFENARLYNIATTDELTGLYTKRHFKYYIEKKFVDFEQFGDKFTLLMLDLDNFKRVNDTYGHVAGDAVLRGVARCITQSIRENDFAFRYGGEELGVVLPATGMKSGRHVAERIRACVEASVFEEGQLKMSVTVSIGVSTCPEDAITVKDLILTADKALYTAKETGKNKVTVAPEL